LKFTRETKTQAPALALAAILLVLTSVNLATASGSRIAFVRTVGGSNIWLTDNTGFRPEPLTRDGMDAAPSFGRNDQIAFQRHDASGDNIWIMKSDGTGQTQLTTDGEDNSPSLGPNGQIAFVRYSRPLTNPNIWIMNSDGTGQIQLTTDGEDGTPSFGLNGQIAFVRGGNNGVHIWIMDGDGTDQIQLTTNPNDVDPSFGPNGQIAFVRYGASGANIWIMNGDGTGQIPLTTDGSDVRDSFGPNGQIAFERDYDSFKNADVWIMNSDGTGQLQLTDFPMDAEPSIEPGLATALASLTANASTAAYGQAVNLTTAITVSAGSPTGSVTFLDGTAQLGEAPVQNGQAVLSTSSLTVGDHSLTAVYSGDSNFAGATSNPVTVTTTYQFPGGISMVSVPYDYGSTAPDAAALFGLTAAIGPAPIAIYDPVKSAYDYYPTLLDSGKQTRPGRSYWVLENAAQASPDAGALVASPFIESLSPGWNMIGDPYLNALDVSSLQLTAGVSVGGTAAGTAMTEGDASTAGLIDGPFWSYDTGAQQYAQTVVLSPFAGDWVYIDPTVSGAQPVTLTFVRPGS